MVEISFFSDSKCGGIYPSNLGRCVSTLHYGARSISAQWNDAFMNSSSKRIKLNSRLLPSMPNVDAVLKLRRGDQWIYEGVLIAEVEGVKEGTEVPISTIPSLLNFSKEIFELCSEGIQNDLERIKFSWRTRTLVEEERAAWAKSGVFIHGPMDKIHIAPGARIRSCSLNTEEGEIIIGADSELMEGCCVRGPFVLGPKSQIKMGATVYGPTSIGENCRIGGEVNNCVFHDYSNKAHEGFLGNSVIGSWCNLGALTSSSNLKNNYSEISLWNNDSKSFEKSGMQFCGLLMGDHSKTAIHTSFNTGTIVGAFCNVFGNLTPQKHIPSFTWGDVDVYEIEKVIDTVTRVMKRRDKDLSSEEELNIRQLHKSSTFGM